MGRIRCRECVFRAAPGAIYTCDYARITGTTRKAVPADRCKHFLPAGGGRAATRKSIHLKNSVDFRRPRGRKSTYNWKAAWELYRQGRNDPEIAQAIGCSKQTVQKWRKKNGLTAQRWKR